MAPSVDNNLFDTPTGAIIGSIFFIWLIYSGTKDLIRWLDGGLNQITKGKWESYKEKRRERKWQKFIEKIRSHTNWKQTARIGGIVNGCLISLIVYFDAAWWWVGLMAGMMTYEVCKHAIEEYQSDAGVIPD